MKTNFFQRPVHTLYRALTFASLVALSTMSISCDDNDDSTPAATQSIVTLAQGNSNLTSLVTALTKYPDLVSTLNSTSQQFTVFAPTNDAFTALLQATGQTSINDLPEDVLRDVLEYHVVAGNALRANQLTSGDVNTVGNEKITVAVGSGVTLNGATKVTTADVAASNGVVHVVDAVLIPPSIQPIVGTIVTPAFFNKNFTTLIAAVKAADASILTTLLGNGPSAKKLTLFAPTNDAFTKAGITILPDKETLNAVLKYHVLDDEVLSNELPTGSAAITTLNGNFYLSNGTAGVFINGTSKVTAVDIRKTNGVVHVIDRTLLPPAKTIAQIVSDYAGATSNKQFTKLLQALQRTSGQGENDLLAAAGAAGNLTVFAPTDAAFEQLGVNLETVDLSTLTNILKHHIVGSRVFSTDLSSGSVATLYKNVSVNVTNLTVTGAKQDATASNLQTSLLNIHATNGVIHVIDRVLLPE